MEKSEESKLSLFAFGLTCTLMVLLILAVPTVTGVLFFNSLTEKSTPFMAKIGFGLGFILVVLSVIYVIVKGIGILKMLKNEKPEEDEE